MEWNNYRVEYTEQGDTFCVARPSFVMAFFGHGRELIAHAERLFQRFLAEVPAGTKLYCLGNNSREYKPLDARFERRVRKTLTELDKKGRFYALKDAPEFDLNEFSCELHHGGNSARPFQTDTVHWSFPVSCGEEPERMRDLFHSIVGEFPFWAAVAGYGFDLVSGREYEQVGMPGMFRTAQRYQGMLLRDRNEELDCNRYKLQSAGWLTYLGENLLEQVGGLSKLEASLSSSAASLVPTSTGVMLQAGPLVSIGDVNRQAEDIICLAEVNRAIAKARLESWRLADFFGVSRDRADAWLHRLDP